MLIPPELSRTYCILLSLLNRYYFHFVKKEHWEYTTLKGSDSTIYKRIWNFTPDILKAVFIGKVNTRVDEIYRKLSELDSDILMSKGVCKTLKTILLIQ